MSEAVPERLDAHTLWMAPEDGEAATGDGGIAGAAAADGRQRRGRTRMAPPSMMAMPRTRR